MRGFIFLVVMLTACFANGQEVLKSPLTIGSSRAGYNAFADVEAMQSVGSKGIELLFRKGRIVKLAPGLKVGYLGTYSLHVRNPKWTLEKLDAKARIPTDSLVYKIKVLDGKYKGKAFFVRHDVLGCA